MIYDQKIKDYHNPNRNLYRTLKNSAARFPDKNAIIDDKEEVTYRELLRRTDVLSETLYYQYGLREHDQIAIVMCNSSAIVAAFYAAMKIGCTCLMVNTKFRSSEIYELLSGLEPKLILCDEMWLEKVEESAVKLKLEVLTAESIPLLTSADRAVPMADDPEDTAVIMHTSGTTGFPKGIMVSQGNIMEASFGYQEVQGLDSNDITVLSVPIFHILGLSCVTTLFMYMGATEVLSAFYDVKDVIRKIRKYRPTHFHSVPAVHLQLINCTEEEKDFTSIRTAIIGGAPISREDIDRVEAQMPNATIRLAYGMTETAGSGTLSLTHKGPLHAVPNVYMRTVDADHKDIPVGQIGELVFGGPCIATGRWQLPSLPDWNEYSGDVGRMDEDGNVYILDRVKDIVNRGGEKIFPIQIEMEMLKFPGIARAAVYAVGDEKLGEVPYAAIIPEEGAEVSITELKAYLKGRISTYETPVHFDIVDEFPVTHNGKVRKGELRKAKEAQLTKDKLSGCASEGSGLNPGGNR